MCLLLFRSEGCLRPHQIELQTPPHAQQSLSAVVSRSDASDRPGDTPTIWRIYWPRRRPTRLDSNYFLFEKTLMASFNNFFVDGSLENIAGAKFCPAELLTRRPSSVNRFS